LLRNADIAKPYVLVGHSWGGALARLYAGTHDDVKAVVLVDASSPGQDSALKAAIPPEKPGEPPLLRELRSPLGAAIANPEYLAWHKSLTEVGEVKSLGDRPLIVITAGNTFVGFKQVMFPVWLKLQNRLPYLSSRSVHVLSPTSGHYVQVEAPELVLAAVRAAASAARNDGRLARCTMIFRNVANRRCLR
jgi:pimeloyl-ACP methyl ester carboxylesterase